MAGRLAEVEQLVEQFQDTTQALKYSMVPTVAAVDGLALGGGCEFIMHCDRAVATLESYIGLVEVGVGLLPAGGGCKEFAMRAARKRRAATSSPFIQQVFRDGGDGAKSAAAPSTRASSATCAPTDRS